MEQLIRFFQDHQRIFVITGAGLSTASGIPDYRDEKGDWKRKSPITHQQFTGAENYRKRYWSRSMVGWKLMNQANPNQGHFALAAIEDAGLLQIIVTQNVDGLHQLAGSQHVVELHGSIARCICLNCNQVITRDDLQVILEQLNPDYAELTAETAPDGDADVAEQNTDNFRVPRCTNCRGTLMPDVVYYGGSVPKPRVAYISAQLAAADALLVVGSTLTTYSSYRYCLAGMDQNKPIAAINRGVTRADSLLSFKIENHCGEALATLANRINAGTGLKMR